MINHTNQRIIIDKQISSVKQKPRNKKQRKFRGNKHHNEK